MKFIVIQFEGPFKVILKTVLHAFNIEVKKKFILFIEHIFFDFPRFKRKKNKRLYREGGL